MPSIQKIFSHLNSSKRFFFRLGKRKFASMILEKGVQQKKARQDGKLKIYVKFPSFCMVACFPCGCFYC